MVDKSIVIPQYPIDTAVFDAGSVPSLRTSLFHPDGTAVDSLNPLPVAATFDVTSNPGNLQIQNVVLPTANTEVAITIPNKTIQFEIRARPTASLKFSFTSGESGTKYVEIKRGAGFVAKDLYLVGKTLYIQSPTAGTTVEFLAWTQ